MKSSSQFLMTKEEVKEEENELSCQPKASTQDDEDMRRIWCDTNDRTSEIIEKSDFSGCSNDAFETVDESKILNVDFLVNQTSSDFFDQVNQKQLGSSQELEKTKQIIGDFSKPLFSQGRKSVKLDTRISAKCIYQPVELTVEPNQRFKMSWIFENTGSSEWPQRAVFTKSEGHQIFDCEQEIALGTPPKFRSKIEVQFHAPSAPGVYRAAFRLFHSGNILFGDEAKLHIVVQQADALVMPKAPVVSSQNMDYSLHEVTEGA